MVPDDVSWLTVDTERGPILQGRLVACSSGKGPGEQVSRNVRWCQVEGIGSGHRCQSNGDGMCCHHGDGDVAAEAEDLSVVLR